MACVISCAGQEGAQGAEHSEDAAHAAHGELATTVDSSPKPGDHVVPKRLEQSAEESEEHPLNNST